MSNANSTNSRVQVFSLTGIDGKTTTSTLIFTPTSTFTPSQVFFELTSVSGFVSVSSISIGTNSASYDNILPISVLAGMSGLNNVLLLSISSVISSVSANTGIYINVTAGAIATTYTIKCSIMGFYN